LLHCPCGARTDPNTTGGVCANCGAELSASTRPAFDEGSDGLEPEKPAFDAAKRKRRVIIESPYGKRVDGSTCTPEEIAANVEYFWRCVKDSLDRGEAPFGSHGFYPHVLDDGIAVERTQGIMAGFAWAEVADARAFYLDRGATPGMLLGRVNAIKMGQQIETRRIGE
jgi:hypothetical protein